MNELIKFLKSFGLKEKDIERILERTNYDPQGLYGTNVYSGMFGKPTAEQMKEIPFLRAKVLNPLRGEKAQEGFVERLAYGRNVLNLYDDEIAKIGELILNKQLVLTPEQRKIMLMNVNTRNQIANDIKLMEEQAERSKVLSMEGEVIKGDDLKSLQKTSGKQEKETLKNLDKGLSEILRDLQKRIKETTKKATPEKPKTISQLIDEFGADMVKKKQIDDEGLVRAAARQIMYSDIKSGKFKFPKDIEDIVMGSASGDPLPIFQDFYGLGAMETLDDLIPEFNRLSTAQEAEKLARGKFNFEPKLERPKSDTGYTAEEFKKILEQGESTAKTTSIDDLFNIYKNKTPKELMFDADAILKGKLHPELSTEQRQELVEKLEDIIFDREPPETFAEGGVANLFVQRDM